jgi:hypothetical protein
MKTFIWKHFVVAIADASFPVVIRSFIARLLLVKVNGN